VQLTIVQNHIVLVELPSTMPFSQWGVVQKELAISQEEAIEQAIRRTPQLTEYVPPGIMRFMAIPIRDVPVKRASVVGQEVVI